MWTAVAAISANIEALILVEAFGLEQTLETSSSLLPSRDRHSQRNIGPSVRQ